MWRFPRPSCGGLWVAFYLGYIAISLRCSTERNLSGRLVHLLLGSFCYFTALFPNDTVIRLIRCFCFKKVHPCVVKSDAWAIWAKPCLQWLGWCRTTTYYNFETLSHLGHLFARFAMTSWRSTERPEDFFSESVVSHLVPWVSSCVVWFCVWLGLFCLKLEDTWLFAFTYSPISGNR